MQFKRQKNAEVSVNLTPLIDVVFLLLIFFMVSTTFTRETHLSLELPEAEGEPAEQLQAEQIEVVISATGQYSVNGHTLVNTQLKSLSQALQEVAGDQRDSPLIITADAKTPHQAVISAMDVAGKLGFSQLSLTTREPEAGD